MQRHIVTSLVFVSAFVGAQTLAQAKSDGTIDITGRIVATTCLIEGKAPGTGGVTRAVALGTISAGVLSTPGATAGDRGFLIRIGGNAECADNLTARIRFDPASPLLDRRSGRLNIDSGKGAATNVQIEMANQDGTPINMYTEDSQGVTIAGHAADIGLIARYYSLGAATEGTAASRVGFQVVYE